MYPRLGDGLVSPGGLGFGPQLCECSPRTMVSVLYYISFFVFVRCAVYEDGSAVMAGFMPFGGASERALSLQSGFRVR